MDMQEQVILDYYDEINMHKINNLNYQIHLKVL